MQNQFIYDDLPQFVMAPYEDCRDPPRLQLLDKYVFVVYIFSFSFCYVSRVIKNVTLNSWWVLFRFDVNGPGSCLKRYSDPTHFKSASRASKLPETKVCFGC